MKIDSSAINMCSGRAFTSSTEITQTTVMSQVGTNTTLASSTSFRMAYTELSGFQRNDLLKPQTVMMELGNDESNPLPSDLYSSFPKQRMAIRPMRESMDNLRNQLLKEIEAFMERIRNQLLGKGNLGVQNSSILDATTSNQPGSFWTRQEYTNVSISETETTTFSSTGTVKTADGRSIDFSISMEMSRSFMESSECLTEKTEYILTDPLVIHLEDVPDTIDDQTFFFDLNCDGTKEEISQLASGNGFLALDRNGNGTIDDGSELFGTKSGNGFKDLSAYDEDGNGWIDENDSIYSKLRVWTKSPLGQDKLLTLEQADVGAIYLGAANTQFSHNNLETNETNAMVRQTGIFLHESSGLAGTIQQIDFATKPVHEVA